MEVQLPSGQCNIFYGNYLYNYSNNWRTRKTFYYHEGKFIESVTSTTTGTYQPSSPYHCLVQGEIVYKPEVKVYFPLLAGALFVFILILVYKIFIKRLLP